MKRLLLGLSALLMLTSTASAGFLIDPYLGFRFSGEIVEDTNRGDEDEYEFSGLAYGARVGYDYFGIMFGVEYGMASSDIEQSADPECAGIANCSVVGKKHEGDFKNLGIFVGYNVPLMFRVWFTYFLSAEMELTGKTDQTDLGGDTNSTTTYDGGGYSLGVGYTGLPFLSINLEYKKLTYNEIDFVGAFSATADLPTSSHVNFGSRGELDSSEIMLSVSLPLDL